MPISRLPAGHAARFVSSLPLFAALKGREHPFVSPGPTLAALLACALFLSPTSAIHAQTNNSPKASIPPPTAHALLNGLQDAFADLADKVEPAVVTLYSVKTIHAASEREGRGSDKNGFTLPPRRITGTGSGVLISADGWVLTNDHVVGGADRVTVKLHDGREFTGEVRRDRRSDLALVKISSPSPFPAATLGNSDKIKTGHWAVAIGSPYRYEGSFSVGVISSLARRQQIADSSVPSGIRIYSNMIQTDAAINPGNSGGPLCNIDGEIIGINTAIESESGGSVGIGFAIPINYARQIADQLRDKGHVDYGFLGVSLVTVTPRQASALRVEYGALLDTEPLPATPAGKAGLRAGDVVTAMNGKAMHTESDLRLAIGQTPPGTLVELAVMREGHPQTIKATLERAEDIRDDAPKTLGKPKLGIEVQALTAKLISDSNVASTTKGVLVKAIDPETSAADTRGLSRGDIILRVNGKDTPTVEAFQAAVGSVRSGDQITVVYLQTGGEPLKRFAVVAVE